MKRKWWLVLCLTSFMISGCGDGSGSGTAAGSAAGQATSFYNTPANLQPLEQQLAQVGIRFAQGSAYNGTSQVSAPILDIQYFQAYYPGRAAAQYIESAYVSAVQMALSGGSGYGGYQSPYGGVQQPTGQLDAQTYFTLSVKLNVVQGLMSLPN